MTADHRQGRAKGPTVAPGPIELSYLFSTARHWPIRPDDRRANAVPTKRAQLFSFTRKLLECRGPVPLLRDDPILGDFTLVFFSFDSLVSF